jgi:hypothetical protein
MEVAAFWICVAAVIIMVGWFKSKGEAQKHQTFRTIVEKTGTVDEAQLRMLFDTPSVWTRPIPFREPPRGGTFRMLRVIGSVVMFLAGGLMLFSGVLLGMLFPETGPGTDQAMRIGPSIGMALSGFVFLLGAGVFFSSRFVEKPPSVSDQPRIGSERE